MSFENEVKKNIDETNTEMVLFFKTLALRIEDKTISQFELGLAGDMYMKYIYDIASVQELSSDRIQKYLFTGYYVTEVIKERLKRRQGDT